MNGEDPYIALLNIRNTPQEGNNYSPVQKLMGRHTKTLLPTNPRLLTPNFVAEYKDKIDLTKSKVAERCVNRKTLPPLKTNDLVRMQPINSKTTIWKPASVCKQVNPRAYIVRTDDGKQYRRDRQHLRLQHVESTSQSTDSLVPPLTPAPSNYQQERDETDDENMVLIVPSVVQPSPVRTTRSGRKVNLPARYRN